jgi:hypothetical protein
MYRAIIRPVPVCLIVAALSIGIAASESPPRQSFSAAFTASREIYSTGQDQSAQLQAAYDSAANGDTIRLHPQGGLPFVISKTLNWTNATGRTVHVEASGATITGTADPLIQYGGTLGDGTTIGKRGYGNWHGGTINGNVQLVNWCYSSCRTAVVGSTTLVLDNCSSYNIFAGRFGDGQHPAIIVDQRTAAAWANANSFVDCRLQPSPTGMIVTTNKTATWGLGVWRFARPTIEGAGKLLDVGRVQIVFDAPYFEGQQDLGTFDPASVIIVDTLGGNVNWLKTLGVKVQGSSY